MISAFANDLSLIAAGSRPNCHCFLSQESITCSNGDCKLPVNVNICFYAVCECIVVINMSAWTLC